MKASAHVHILHNPNAGDQNNTKKDLVNLIESAGFSCNYASVKDKGWQRFKPNPDLLVIAGGDGSIRQVTKKLLNRRLLDKRLPMMLLPIGTANNFAKTPELSSEPLDLPLRINKGRLQKVDVGVIYNLPKASFFLEGMGFGLFPKLISVMKEPEPPQAMENGEELDIAYKKLVQLAQQEKATYAKLTIDGHVYEGTFLLIEILNARSIGPNFVLAPRANLSDGKLHVALLREEKREEFLTYLRHHKKQPTRMHAHALPWELIELTDEIIVRLKSGLVHVDDELFTIGKNKRLKLEVRKEVLDVFL